MCAEAQNNMRMIMFNKELRRSSVERLLATLRQANAPRNVFVSSPGGSFDFFSTLGPAIERQGIVTLAGDVRSAAVLLFLLGHVRKVIPESTFFFHEVRALVGPVGEITISNLEEVEEYENQMSGNERESYQEWRRSMKAAQSWFIHYVSRQSGISIPTFLSLMRSEATLSAREALRYGIAHRLIHSDSEI